MREIRNEYKILVGKCGRKRPTERKVRVTQRGMTETLCKDKNLVHKGQYRVQCKVPVHQVKFIVNLKTTREIVGVSTTNCEKFFGQSV
jgi:hypothetical protein